MPASTQIVAAIEASNISECSEIRFTSVGGRCSGRIGRCPRCVGGGLRISFGFLPLDFGIRLASINRSSENISVLPVVISELELSDIERLNIL
jgi:hypothetical protein